MQYKKEEIRKRIIDTAFKEFEKEGYKGASVLNIATNSKTTIGNLYRYFNGKAALFDAIVGRASEELPRLMMRYYALNYNGVSNSSGSAGEIAEGIASAYKDFGREIFLLMDKSEGSKYAGFGKSIRDNIMNMCRYGVYRIRPEDNLLISEIIAENFISGLYTIFRKAPEAERAEEIKKLILFYFSGATERVSNEKIKKLKTPEAETGAKLTLMEKISKGIVKYRLIVVIVFGALMVASAIMTPFVGVNYNDLDYLPEDSEIVKGLEKCTTNSGTTARLR
jgi:Transcriptional regulator